MDGMQPVVERKRDTEREKKRDTETERKRERKAGMGIYNF